MIKVNISIAKKRLLQLAHMAQAGELVLICEQNIRVAQLLGYPRQTKKKRPLGPPRSGFTLTQAFFDPLPTELQAEFEGFTSCLSC